MLSQQPCCRYGLGGGYITRACQHDVWFAVIIAGELPYSDAARAVFSSLAHIQPLQLRLFAAGHNVDQISGAQAQIHDMQETITVGRKIYAHHFTFLYECIVYKSGCLVTVAVMILPPNVTGEKHVQRRNRPTP